jgi:hypothetical protein
VYYILTYESFESEALELPRPTLPDEDMAFHNGVPVANAPRLIEFRMTAEEKGELGDYVTTGLPGLVVSKRFKEVLDGAGVDNVQYVPATIHDEVADRTYRDYFVANVIGLVDCIDMKRSKVTMRAALPDKIRDIDELHVDEKRAKGHAIFRLARKSSLVLVNERVKKALERSELKGVALVEAEGYST